MAQQTRTYMDDVRTLDPAFFLIVGAVVGFLAAAIVFNSDFLSQDFLDGLCTGGSRHCIHCWHYLITSQSVVSGRERSESCRRGSFGNWEVRSTAKRNARLRN